MARRRRSSAGAARARQHACEDVGALFQTDRGEGRQGPGLRLACLRLAARRPEERAQRASIAPPQRRADEGVLERGQVGKDRVRLERADSPSSTRSSAVVSASARPSRATLPPSGGSVPASSRRTVVFPIRSGRSARRPWMSEARCRRRGRRQGRRRASRAPVRPASPRWRPWRRGPCAFPATGAAHPARNGRDDAVAPVARTLTRRRAASIGPKRALCACQPRERVRREREGADGGHAYDRAEGGGGAADERRDEQGEGEEGVVALRVHDPVELDGEAARPEA